MREHLLRQECVVPGKSTRQGRAQRVALQAQRTFGELCEHARIALARDERLDHLAARRPRDVGRDGPELDVGDSSTL